MNEATQAISELIRIARGEVGVREDGGQNTGTRVVEYQGATWLHPGPWPWCAAFTCWLLREWVEKDDVRNALAHLVGRESLSIAQVEKVRCRDASAFGWEKWAKGLGLSIIDESSLAKAGDFVVFDFSHIGIVVEDQRMTSRAILTIEGNTNVKGAREGDGVWEKSRSPELVRSYIRLFP